LTRLPVTQEIAGSIPVETVQMPIQEDRHFFAFNIILIKDIWMNDNHIDLSVRPFSLKCMNLK
ncbi:hypothetical protein KCV88_10935, partial [Staphylococcus aureus]|nr:hypothetical protein [Staphylococcus aureus]